MLLLHPVAPASRLLPAGRKEAGPGSCSPTKLGEAAAVLQAPVSGEASVQAQGKGVPSLCFLFLLQLGSFLSKAHKPASSTLEEAFHPYCLCPSLFSPQKNPSPVPGPSLGQLPCSISLRGDLVQQQPIHCWALPPHSGPIAMHPF